MLLVKLADRLHNMRTLKHMKPDTRQRVAQETLELYAPLAGRMGMQNMRDELEDIAFRELNPEANRTIVERLRKLHEESGDVLKEIESELAAKFARTGIVAASSRAREAAVFDLAQDGEKVSRSASFPTSSGFG